MEQDFERIAQRAAVLRLTENELIAKIEPPMSYVTYWRAKKGITQMLGSRVKVIRRVEELLDQLEQLEQRKRA